MRNKRLRSLITKISAKQQKQTPLQKNKNDNNTKVYTQYKKNRLQNITTSCKIKQEKIRKN